MSHRPQVVAGQANEEKTGRLEAFSDGLWSIRAISSRDASAPEQSTIAGDVIG